MIRCHFIGGIVLFYRCLFFDRWTFIVAVEFTGNGLAFRLIIAGILFFFKPDHIGRYYLRTLLGLK